MAKVLESFVLGKSGDPLGGEDRALCADAFFAVFDGVTSRGRAVDERLLLGGCSPGRFAAEQLADLVAGMDPGVDAVSAFEMLSAGLDSRVRALGVDPEVWGWPAASQVAIFSAARRELWRLGDISISVNGTPLPDLTTPLDVPALGFRAAMLWALIAGGADKEQLRADDPSWAALLPLLELQDRLRNCPDLDNPFAYGLVDGRPPRLASLQVFSVAGGDEVVFASDGYVSPAASLGAAEAELARVLERDPLLIDLHRGFRPVSPGMVSFDDRAYLRFRV